MIQLHMIMFTSEIYKKSIFNRNDNLILKIINPNSKDHPCIENENEVPVGMTRSNDTGLVTTIEKCLNDYIERKMGCLLPWCKLEIIIIK